MISDYLDDIESALQVLKRGGIILYPTDTIWGIGGDATRDEVVERILALKNRPKEKGMIALVEGIEGIEGIGGRPTTYIVAGFEGLAGNILAPDGTIGVRVPADEFCLELIKRFGKPLISTSANVSGEAPATVFSEITAEILEGVDYVVKWRRFDERRSQPSRVVKVLAEGKIQIIRE